MGVWQGCKFFVKIGWIKAKISSPNNYRLRENKSIVQIRCI